MTIGPAPMIKILWISVRLGTALSRRQRTRIGPRSPLAGGAARPEESPDHSPSRPISTRSPGARPEALLAEESLGPIGVRPVQRRAGRSRVVHRTATVGAAFVGAV